MPTPKSAQDLANKAQQGKKQAEQVQAQQQAAITLKNGTTTQIVTGDPTIDAILSQNQALAAQAGVTAGEDLDLILRREVRDTSARRKIRDEAFAAAEEKYSTGTDDNPVPPYLRAPTEVPYYENKMGSSKDLMGSNAFLALNDQEMIDAVVAASGGDFKKFNPVMQYAATEAALRQKAGHNTTVMDVLRGWQENGLPKALRDGGGGGGGGSQAFTDRSTQINLTNEGQARRIVNAALTGALGRESTKEEQAAFLKALNANERANPTVTVTKGVRSASGTTSKSTTKGGFDSTDFADRYAKSQEGYAEYQAATTYLDSFIGALESDTKVI